MTTHTAQIRSLPNPLDHLNDGEKPNRAGDQAADHANRGANRVEDCRNARSIHDYLPFMSDEAAGDFRQVTTPDAMTLPEKIFLVQLPSCRRKICSVRFYTMEQLPFEADPSFLRFCFWLGFMCLVTVTICLPLLVICLWRLGDDTKIGRSAFSRERNQIAGELEKLREELASRRGTEKDR